MRKPSWLFLLVFISACIIPCFAAPKEDPERAKTFLAVKSLLAQSDTFMAIEYLNGLGDPLIVAGRYSDLVTDFYWKGNPVCPLSGADRGQDRPGQGQKTTRIGKDHLLQSRLVHLAGLE